MQPAGAPWYGFYGDDFTGATDTLATLSRAGLRAMLFMGMPDAARLHAAGPLDAIGVAGSARAMDAGALAAELEPVGRGFAALGVRVMHYKVCSTFDSAPHTGSIGLAIRTLRTHFPNPLVAIVGGQPDLRRYCAFGNLFAAAAGPAVHRIDRHPTMSRHPVTPMGEADLRLHLQAQGLSRIALLDCRTYALPPAQQAQALEAQRADGAEAVLFDVLANTDLQAIGALLSAQARHLPLLAVGASSVAQALAPAMGAGSTAGQAPPPAPASPGPVFVLAGSLSPLTARQIAHAASFRKIELAPAHLAGPGAARYIGAMVEQIATALLAGQPVLAYTSRTGEQAAKPGESPGGRGARDDTPAHGRSTPPDAQMLAAACARVLCQVLERVPLRRVAVAGGDTSSYAMQALDAWGLSCIGTVCPGVALSRLHSGRAALDGLEIVLKGGQMGGDTFFEALLGPL